jgi:hypothetical protein
MARLNERMIVADSKDDPPQTVSHQARPEGIPTDSSSSLFLAISTPGTWQPSQSIPMATSTARQRITPFSRSFSQHASMIR